MEAAERDRERNEATERLLRPTIRAYDALEISSSASEADVRKKFIRLSKFIHPDKSPHPRAGEAFQRLKDFYESALASAASPTQWRASAAPPPPPAPPPPRAPPPPAEPASPSDSDADDDDDAPSTDDDDDDGEDEAGAGRSDDADDESWQHWQHDDHDWDEDHRFGADAEGLGSLDEEDDAADGASAVLDDSETDIDAEEDAGDVDDGENTCSICLEPTGAGDETLSCGHVYHTQWYAAALQLIPHAPRITARPSLRSIARWLQSKQACPLCRTSVRAPEVVRVEEQAEAEAEIVPPPPPPPPPELEGEGAEAEMAQRLALWEIEWNRWECGRPRSNPRIRPTASATCVTCVTCVTTNAVVPMLPVDAACRTRACLLNCGSEPSHPRAPPAVLQVAARGGVAAAAAAAGGEPRDAAHTRSGGGGRGEDRCDRYSEYVAGRAAGALVVVERGACGGVRRLGD